MLTDVHSSAEDPLLQSYGCLIKKAGMNPVAINEIKQYTVQQSKKLSWPEGEVFGEPGDSSLGSKFSARPSTVRWQRKNSSVERISTHTRGESWPQAKRRKVELQAAHSFANSQCFRVTNPHSFQRDAGNMYLKTFKTDVDSGHMKHLNMSTDMGICLDVNTDQIEGQSAILSQHGEVGSPYIGKNERKNTSPVTNNKHFVATISSLLMAESSNSQRCFLKGTGISPLSCDNLDARISGDKQHSQNFCNETQQFPEWEDDLNVRHSVLSLSNEDLQPSDVDHLEPVFEGFTVNAPISTDELGFAADEFDLCELELPRTTLERASILAEICRSASLDRPLSHFSSAFKFRETWDLCKSVPDDDHLELMEFGNISPLNPDVGKHLQSHRSSSDDYKVHLGERYGWSSKSLPSSPVSKLWGQLSSHTGSSGKCSNSNPELTCFPIEEDPSSSEDNKIMEENAGDVLDGTESSFADLTDTRQPLNDLTNMCRIPPISDSIEEETLRSDSVDLLGLKHSFSRIEDKALLDPKYQFRKNSKTREKQTSLTHTAEGRKHQLSSIGPNAIKKAKQSVSNSTRKSMSKKISRPIVSNKTSLKEHGQKLSLKESRRNNIVSNVSSFIPLVQQKQAAAECKVGKRDVKVKALEAAEAAKCLEERKENERKMRKEALKLERAKLEEKRLRDNELEKKKKDEEQKKKDADIIAKKRLREEEERKEKEKKRMRVEARQRHKEQEEKKRAVRPEKENQRTKDAQMNNKKEFINEPKRQQNKETAKGESKTLQKTETNLTLNDAVVNYEECGTSGISCEAGEGMDKSPRKEDFIVQTSKGKSYEISPYQCSEDEDEDDDELPTKKYIPSWASKSSVARFLPLLKEMDPDVIFPRDYLYNTDAVLVPRKQQQKRAAM